MNSSLQELRDQVMWNRLVSVVNELAHTLIRTAFSPSTREAGDLSAGVFDPAGRMVAQAATGTPGHVNSMAKAVGHFLKVFPIDSMKPGDVYVTNDPWLASGHLNDFTTVTPAFHLGRAVGLFAATVHVSDIGGLGVGIEARDVHQEGLYVPIMAMVREGRIDETLMALVRRNVRDALTVEGDLHALITANAAGCRALQSMLTEFGMDDFQALGERILAQSGAAMRTAIAALPAGVYRHSMRIDGIDEPIDLVAALTISADRIEVDYTGTSRRSPFGINVPLCYTEAYTTYGIRCLVGNRIPNNAGSLAAVRVTAPEGTILNALYPAPVAARHMIGQMLPDVMLGCLAQVLPLQVQAESASCLWNLRLSGGAGAPGMPTSATAGRRFHVTTFNAGGAGGRAQLDGLSATAFPAGVRNVPLETIEAVTPLVFWRKELRPDSGGAGRQRGGDGQVIEVGHAGGEPFVINATFDRVDHPSRGIAGGAAGAPGTVRLDDGTVLAPKGRQLIPAGRRLVVELPGGGGYGDVRERSPQSVLRDVIEGRMSREAAHAVYGTPFPAP